MKKILSMAMAILLVASMTACGSKPKSKTVTEGKLTIGTSADFAPYEFHILDENGKAKIVGFDVSLAEAIAKDMGLELVIKDMAFDAILMEINAGTIDMGLAGFSPDEERKKAVDFSDIYYTGGQSVMIKKDDAAKFKTIADLNKAELSVGAQTGSIQEKLAKENTPTAKYVGLQAVPNIIMELSSGKINACFMETVVAESYMKTQKDLMILCEVPYDAEGSAIAIKKGNTELITAANASIKKLKEDGSIGKFVEEANAIMDKAVS
ncbi:MAG: transporter substrate-binding domain-containing protein [Angelakisella sp.]